MNKGGLDVEVVEILLFFLIVKDLRLWKNNEFWLVKYVGVCIL